MLVHFFLQGAVLLIVLAIVRWHVAWAYIPLIPFALAALLLVTCALGIMLSAINVYLRDTSHFLELALLAWFWVTPVVYAFQTVGEPRTTGCSSRSGWRTRSRRSCSMFQRALYAKLDNTTRPSAVTPLLPHWPYWGFVAYLGYSFVFGGRSSLRSPSGCSVARRRTSRRSSRWRPRSRSAASPSSSSCTTSTTRR